MAEIFCTGDAMRGGRLHHNVAAHSFLGRQQTAPIYRFFSIRDEFPGLVPSTEGGASITGELYDVPADRLRTDFLPEEPAELELTIVNLDDGRSVLAMMVRRDVMASRADELTDITSYGGWRRYRGLPDPS